MFTRSSSSFALLVFAGLLWGTGGITGRALADSSGLAAPAIAAYRLGLGGAVLTALQLSRGLRLSRARAAWLRIAAIGALAAVFQSAYFSAVAIGTVSSATLTTIGSAPIFVVAFEVARTRRRPEPAVVRPVLAGVAGLALLVGVPGGGASLASSLGAAGLAAISGAAFAGFTLLGRRPLVETVDQTAAGLGFLLGGGALALLAAPFTALSFAPTTPSLGLVILFATVPTAVAYALFFRGLRGSTAATATVVALLEPLTATMLAVTLLGERLPIAGVAGAALLLLSVLDAGRTQLRAQRPVPRG